MAKYVLVYHGGKMAETEEEKDRIMAAWGAWMEGLGEALVDPGNPFAPPASIGGETSDPATGYSIIEAESQDAAVQLASSNPLTSEDGTRIDVHEAFPM